MPAALRRLRPLAVALPVLALAACGSSGPEAAPPTLSGQLVGQVCCVVAATAGEVDGVSTAFNGWDTALIVYTAPHDAVAAQYAALAADRSDDADLKAFAATIEQVQQQRYVQLAALAAAWGQPTPSTDPAAAAGHDHGGGSNAADTAVSLAALTGPDFDRAFVTAMLGHHQALVPVSQNEIANGINPQAQDLARQIIDEQNAGLDTLRKVATAVGVS